MTMVDMRSNYTKDILEALESTYGETIGIFDSRIPNVSKSCRNKC